MRGTCGEHSAVRQQGEVIAGAGGEVQVVQHHPDRPPFCSEVTEQLGHIGLEAEVESGDGLVQQHHLGGLRELLGDEDELALATGEAVDPPLPQMLRAHSGEGRIDHVTVLRGEVALHAGGSPWWA